MRSTSAWFWKNFAEVPGAAILLVLTVIQLTFVAGAERNEMVSRTLHLENIVVSICGRIDHLEMATLGGRSQLERSCEFYDASMARSDDPYHWTWVEAGEVLFWMQLVTFLIGATWFLGGLAYRFAALAREP